MGYYTRHELTIVSGGNNEIDYEKEISILSNYDNCFDDEIKWYNHKNDMIKYSKSHPDTLFLVEEFGEEDGDIWKHWFKNGKSFYSKAKMVFEELDESKLQ